MTLIKWSPFELYSLQDEMNRIFNAYFSRMPESGGKSAWNPVVDISESDEDIVVYAEIPGLSKDEVKISIQDNVLTLSGEKKKENEKKGKNYHRVERSYGFFERSFSLPSSIASEKVKASYKDGILTIVLPKTEEAKPKEIHIHVN